MALSMEGKLAKLVGPGASGFGYSRSQCRWLRLVVKRAHRGLAGHRGGRLWAQTISEPDIAAAALSLALVAVPPVAQRCIGNLVTPDEEAKDRAAPRVPGPVDLPAALEDRAATS